MHLSILLQFSFPLTAPIMLHRQLGLPRYIQQYESRTFLCYQTSLYEKYEQLRILLHKGSHHVLSPNQHFLQSGKHNIDIFH